MDCVKEPALAPYAVAAALFVALSAQAQYVVTNLVSDGSTPATFTDEDLGSSWGVAPSTSSDGLWWVSNEATGLSTRYDENGNVNPTDIVVPAARDTADSIGSPTGVAYHTGQSFFVSNGRTTGVAKFIFATRDGVIAAWSPGVPFPGPATEAVVMHTSTDGAIYTGIAISEESGNERLYVADFFHAQVDIFNTSWDLETIPGAFVDPTLPLGYAPFGIQVIDSKVYVAYAQQNLAATNPVLGPGLGYVSVFDTDGVFIQRLVSNAELNAPWGLAKSPSNFGLASNSLLVGNLGDGRINAFNLETGSFKTFLVNNGFAVEVPGLHGIAFGEGGTTGDTNVLFFTASGFDGESGVFGRIDSDDKGDPDPDPDPDPVDADLDDNGVVDGADLGLLLSLWGSDDAGADLNDDGTVDGADLGLMLGAWPV